MHTTSFAMKLAAGAVAATTAVGAAFPAAAQSAFTKDECGLINETAAAAVRAIGVERLSLDFRQSFRNWLGPNITCDGPREIVIRTGTDADLMNTIRMVLSGSRLKMDLVQRAGLRFVRPTAGLGTGN